MSTLTLKKAQRQQTKLKIGISGASGFGKTYSALLMAYGMTNDWSKIAVIDTENGSADLYSDLGEYNTLTLSPPFSPERYIEAIKACEEAGIEVCIIDSITHEWDGEGGCLEIVEKLGGRYQDWSKVTPRHKNFISAILQAKMHIITTVRRKQDYDMVKNDRGKIEVQKVGTKEVTREGFEYEITLNFEIINDKHLAKASKDRTGLFMGRPEFVINSETGKELLVWAKSGADPVVELQKKISECKSEEELTSLYNANRPIITDEIINLFKKQKETWKQQA
jgi:hypothetical protein